MLAPSQLATCRTPQDTCDPSSDVVDARKIPDDGTTNKEQKQEANSSSAQADRPSSSSLSSDHVSRGDQSMWTPTKRAAASCSWLFQLPEDIVHHIYSLVPLQDAARAACVCRAFLRSWRRYPNLVLNYQTLGRLKRPSWTEEREVYNLMRDELEISLRDRVGHVLDNHSGIGVETLHLGLGPFRNDVDNDASRIDGWLRAFVKPGIKHLALSLNPDKLSTIRISIQSLSLTGCDFHPSPSTTPLGCSFTKLVRLDLVEVCMEEEELGRVFSAIALTLEHLQIYDCHEIAKYIYSDYTGGLWPRLYMRERTSALCGSVGGAETGHKCGLGDRASCGRDHGECAVKAHFSKTYIMWFMVYIYTYDFHHILILQTVSTPMLPAAKIPHLTCLDITICTGTITSRPYDFLSLVSYLHASPALESFTLRVDRRDLPVPVPDSIMEDAQNLRQVTVARCQQQAMMSRLKNVTIMGFTSCRSLVELTNHIVENAAESVEHLTLDTTFGYDRTHGKCLEMKQKAVMEAPRAMEAATTYIQGKVPPTVCFQILGPCSRCHLLHTN
uniref:Uncharacterized protein n=1 Tax=Leersia perrieri TaxID=77586 RepID=A0A0D9VF22_9ORYZ